MDRWAIASIFGSVFSMDRFLQGVGFVSTRAGTPKSAKEITKLDGQAHRREASIIGLLILASVILKFGGKVNSDPVELPGTSACQNSDEPDEWIIVFRRLIGRLAISILGPLAFFILHILISSSILSMNPR